MDQAAHHEKSRAAFSSVLWSAFLTGIKIWAGVETGSLGIISEALHSGLDLMAAGMTFYAVRIAARPADESHPYGHEKVENLSALAETALLLVTCGWIVWEAMDRLFYNEAEITLTWWAFAVVAVSLLVDVNRSAMLRRVAKKHKSQALEADALHFTTDIWSSAVVLLGLFCVWLAHLVPAESVWHGLLEKADAVAALFVAALVCSVAFGLAKRSIHALMDGGSSALTHQVLAAMKKNAPDYPVKHIRLRDGGARIFVELDVEAPAELHVDVAHDVAESIEGIVKYELPEADVIVHIEPAHEDFAGMEPDAVVHRLALRHHVRIHGFYEGRGKHASCYFMDVEVPADWPLDRGYEVVEAFRKDVIQELQPEKVVCRIEPDCREMKANSVPEHTPPEEVHLKVRLILQQHRDIRNIVKLDLDKEDSFPTLTCLCTADPELTVRQSHQIASQLEDQIENALHHLGRVTVILKPETRS